MTAQTPAPPLEVRPPSTVAALRRSKAEPAWFAQVYGAYAEQLLIFLTRRTYDPDVAVDLLAETFAQAFFSRRRFKGGTDDEVMKWLYAIARRQLWKYVRRGRARTQAVRRLGIERPPLTPDEYVRIEELAGLAELRARAADALAALPAGQREVVELRVVEELGYEEIARRLGVSEQTCRTRLSRALRVLSSTIGVESEEVR